MFGRWQAVSKCGAISDFHWRRQAGLRRLIRAEENGFMRGNEIVRSEALL